MERIIGLKIDVDTYLGMKQGVPRLLDLLDAYGLKATFFLSIGPDNSGRAILQFLRNPRFLSKMIRTKAVQAYGWQTALYGTLLPAPMIALSFPMLVKRIIEEGHEVQFHAWDHRRWQDELPRRSNDWIAKWFHQGLAAFNGLTGYPPTAFGAPAWLIDERVLDIACTFGFRYLSCTRADAPFFHEGSGLLEIPSNLPCWEEISGGERWKIITGQLARRPLSILPIHAEIEGGIAADFLLRILDYLKKPDFQVLTLDTIRDRLDGTTLPTRKYRLALLPGRANPCAV